MSVPATVAPGASFVAVTARFDQLNARQRQELAAECANTDNGGEELKVQHLRLAFASALALVLELVLSGKDKQAAVALTDIEEMARKCNDPRAKALLEDITGQVREALTKSPENYFDKWGKHYLPSLARAHLLQQCNNFKDPGIQVYGGEMFQRVRDEIDAIFCKLPPPKPSVRRTTPIAPSSSRGGGGGNYAHYAPVSMSTYHNASGGCFSGEGLVRLADGLEKQAQSIVKGDKVATSLADPTACAEVVCVVKTHCVAGKEDLVTLPGGLRLTAYHPVRDGTGNWRFPIDLAPLERNVACATVYSFVLRGCGGGQAHAAVIQGVECVALAHGIEGDAVATHAYYGTQRVVEDLKKMRGWEAGQVDIFPATCEGGKSVVRDPETGLVCGFAPGANDGFLVGEREP